MVKIVNEMQIVVKNKSGEISCNFDELTEWANGVAKAYESFNFTEETLPEGKSSVADLRKVVAALDTRRKEVKKEFMKPYDDFETKLKDVIAVINKPINDISLQIEEYEKKRVEQKKEEIKLLFVSCIGDNEYVSLEKIYNPKWENKTYLIKDIKNEMEEFVSGIMSSVETIKGLNSDAVSKALDIFKRDFSLSNAITYVNNFERQKQEILEREKEKRAKEEEAKRQHEIDLIREDERKKILAEQEVKRSEDENVQQAVEQAKEEISIENPNGFYKASPGTTIYEVKADMFQLAQLEAAMREYGIEFRRI